MPTAPSTDWSRQSVRLVVALAVVTAGVVGLFCTVVLVHEYVRPLPQVRTLVNVNGEANLPTWWNATLLLMIAFGAAVARTLEHETAPRRAWLTVAAVGVLLSLDEVAGLHERLSAPVKATGLAVPTYAWVVPGVVIAAIGATVLVVVGRGLPGGTRRRLLLALVLYLVGALGVEAINGTLLDADRLIYYLVGTTVEETIEMSACVLAIGAIAAAVASRLPQARPPVTAEGAVRA